MGMGCCTCVEEEIYFERDQIYSGYDCMELVDGVSWLRGYFDNVKDLRSSAPY